MANRYFKLGHKIGSFSDPKSELSIVNQEVVKIDASAVTSSKSVTNALHSGHIKEATVEEYEEYQKSRNPKAAAPAAVEENKSKEAADNEDDDDDEDDEDDEDEETKKPVVKKRGRRR